MTRPSVNRSYLHKEVITVDKGIQKMLLKLPTSVSETFTRLNEDERNEYIKALREKGWTLQSIGEVCGVTRERVRQIAKEEKSLTHSEIISTLDVPEVPRKTSTKILRKKLDEATIERLRELKPLASQVRGYSDESSRTAAQELVALIDEQIKNGVGVPTIAKALGVTHSGVYSRLVRYGYRKSTGDSKVFNPIKGKTSEYK